MSSEGGKVDVDMEKVWAVVSGFMTTACPAYAQTVADIADLIRSHLEAQRLRHVREMANVESTFSALHLRAQQAEELCMAYERAAPGKRERLEVASRLMAAGGGLDFFDMDGEEALSETTRRRYEHQRAMLVNQAVLAASALIAANEAYGAEKEGQR